MRKMKMWATILLMFALIGAVFSWQYRHYYWGGFALAVFEAALVGALADWFAIVALFRHPLGLKIIPHTAIIPNNRDRIIDSIVYMVENQWLKVEVIKKKIEDYKIFNKLVNILQSDEGKNRLRVLIASIITNTIKDTDSTVIAKFIQTLIKENFSNVQISSELLQRLENSLKETYGDNIIDFFVDRSKELLHNEEFYKITKNTLRKAAEDYTRKGFFRRLGKGLGESLDLINYSDAAQAIIDKLQDTIEGIKSPRNPYRAKMKEGIIDSRIAEQGNLAEVLENWIQKIIHTEDGYKIILETIKSIKEQIFAEDMENSVLVKYLTDMAIEQVNNVNLDELKKLHFEAWVKEEIVKLVEKYHNVIGKLVRENLQSLNDENFADSLEERVGEDLQWIRINGTVIGAIVGMIQYLITHIVS